MTAEHADAGPAGRAGQAGNRRVGIVTAPLPDLILGNARAAAILVGLAAVVTLRWAATVGAIADALPVGLAFGLGLVALAVMSGERPGWPRAVSILIGAGGAAVLVALALVPHLDRPGPSLAPAASFLTWASVTILVATAEEAVLRGALFAAVRRHGGVTAAIAVTSVAFALMHVPLYGWHVVPLDLGVGIFLGGLRLASGGIAAPAVAHALADLATWWL